MVGCGRWEDFFGELGCIRRWLGVCRKGRVRFVGAMGRDDSSGGG